MLVFYIGGIHNIMECLNFYYHHHCPVSSVLSTVVVLVYPTSIKRWQICKGREEAFLFNVPNFLGTEISYSIISPWDILLSLFSSKNQKL